MTRESASHSTPIQLPNVVILARNVTGRQKRGATGELCDVECKEVQSQNFNNAIGTFDMGVVRAAGDGGAAKVPV